MHCRSEHITPVFLPGDFHGQRSLVSYSPRGCNESDTTEWPSTHTRKVIGYLKCELALGDESQVWIYLLISLTNGPLIHQFSSVTQLSLTLYHPMDCSMPGLPVHHQLLEFTQIHVRWIGDAIQPSHPLSSLSPPIFNLSQHQGLFKWVSSSHQVGKILEFQIQHQSF